MAAIQTPAQLLRVRFALGIAEAGSSPAILFLISSWYRKHEQSKRFIVYLFAAILSGAFGSIVAGAITARMGNVGGISSWRWLFIVSESYLLSIGCADSLLDCRSSYHGPGVDCALSLARLPIHNHGIYA